MNIKQLFTGILSTAALLVGLTAEANSKVETWSTKEGASVYYGLSSMTANMMTKGTKNLNEEAFLTKLDDLQSSIHAGSSLSTTTFSLRSLVKPELLTPSLDLFVEVMTEADFKENIFERERAQAIDGQKAILDNPNLIANELYNAALYPNSVIGATSKDLEKSLQVLTLADLEVFRNNFYHANNAKIVIVGDIDQEMATAIGNRISSQLKQGEIQPELPVIEPVTTNEIITQKYNSPQTRVMLGQPAIDRFDQDYLPLIIGNHLLGGSGLTSILMTIIREKDGLTYGISSRFNAGIYEGPFTVSFSTKNESVEEAITKTKAVIETFITETPDPDLLQRAKNNYLGSLVLDMDSNAKLANSILGLALFNLPLDYFDTLPEKVNAITPAEIQAAFKRHVNPEEMVTIIVGGDVKDETLK